MTLPNLPPSGGGLPQLPPQKPARPAQGPTLPAPTGLPPAAPARQAPTQLPSSPTPARREPPRPALPQAPARPSGAPQLPSAPIPAPVKPQPAPQRQLPPAPAPTPPPAPQAPVAPPVPVVAPVPVAPPAYEEPPVETVTETPKAQINNDQEDRRAQLEHDNESKKIKGKKPSKNIEPSVKRVLIAEDQRIKFVKFSVYGIVLLLFILSMKSLFFTPKLPSPLDMAIDVTRAMNKTTFPAERAEGFVQEFVRHYLSTAKEGEDRDEILAKYMSGEALQSVNKLTFPSRYTQKVTDGPYVHGIRYVSEETAVFTIGVEINNKSWEYYAVNVFYDRESKGFAIPKPPTVVPQPIMGKSPIEAQLMNINEEASDSARTVVDSYFAAWVSGALTELDVALSADASNNARHSGFAAAGIKFSNVVSLSVLQQAGDFVGTELYMGVAVVEMNKPVDIEGEDNVSEEGSFVRYVAEYNLILEYSGKGNKWLIKDIQPREYIPSGASKEE